MPKVEQADFGLENMDQAQLLIRYQVLRASTVDKPEDEVPDETLKEMVAICQILRRRSSGPPKPAKAARNIIPAADSF